VATDLHTLESDPDTELLDSERDRGLLRDRYYGLLQELRVVLPGVQVLVAFLLTAPFAQRFSGLDSFGKALYGIALTSGTLSVIAFVTPTVLHRFGDRTARRARLELSIAVTRLGLVLLGVSMVTSLAVVVRFLFDGTVAALLVAVTVVAMVGLWIGVPRLVRHHQARIDDAPDRAAVGP
jgi:hypothetical protein